MQVKEQKRKRREDKTPEERKEMQKENKKQKPGRRRRKTRGRGDFNIVWTRARGEGSNGILHRAEHEEPSKHGDSWFPCYTGNQNCY